MKLLRRIGLTAIALSTFSGLAAAQQVQTDYDKNANFSQYRTYEWDKVQTSNPLWQQRVMDAVDRDLQAKDLQRVQSGGDIALMAIGATRDQQEYQTFYNGLGPGWRWRGFGPEATTTVQTYTVGTLVLDMYDANTKRLLWRGTASDTLSEKPEKNENKLSKAVDKMLEKFPPREKK